MKARRKFNRGVIVAAILILCVSIYLIGHAMTQNAEIPAVKKVVESYLKTYVSYNMLPANYRTENPNIPKAEMDSYISKMKDDIKSYFQEGDNSYIYLTDMMKKDLESQKTDTTVVYSYQKSISKYKDFNFDGSNVTVKFETNSNYDGPDINNPEAGRLKLNAVTTDTIVLKKTGGEWKIVYSNINRPSQRNSLGGGFTIKRKVMRGD